MKKYRGFLIYQDNGKFVVSRKGEIIIRCSSENECKGLIDEAAISAIIDHNASVSLI